jgi:hypothetical protein
VRRAPAGGAAVSLAELSELLFSSDAAINQYATYAMLLEDKVYFKQVGVQATPQCPSV